MGQSQGMVRHRLSHSLLWVQHLSALPGSFADVGLLARCVVWRTPVVTLTLVRSARVHVDGALMRMVVAGVALNASAISVLALEVATSERSTIESMHWKNMHARLLSVCAFANTVFKNEKCVLHQPSYGNILPPMPWMCRVCSLPILQYSKLDEMLKCGSTRSFTKHSTRILSPAYLRL